MDLRELYEARFAAHEFRRRNASYRTFEAVYNSETDKPDQVLDQLNLHYRPTNVDVPGREPEDTMVINQVRRVAAHFGSLFARLPRLVVWPPEEDEELAQKLSAYTTSVFTRSNLLSLHIQQSHRLSLLGDACFGVDWEPREGSPIKVKVRCYNPRFCYPRFDPDDFGAVHDIVIGEEVSSDWVNATYGTSFDSGKRVQRYEYWTANTFEVQIEDTKLPRFTRTHNLGFCPFRWAYGDPSGLMAQADVREVPKLQEVFNEGLMLALDAIRKQVDPAFWVTGAEKDITPEPGTANALPEGANVGAWPINADPQIILGTMQFIEGAIQQTTGVSPISASGQASGSIVTGAAVRHQVEAIEQRTESRKVMLEGTYARLGEYILEVTRQIYPQETAQFRTEQGRSSLSGGDIPEDVECDALYGGFLGLSMDQRVQIALAGLGRLWDEEYAVGNILNEPGVTPRQMTQRLRTYQINQAMISAQAQGAAQQVLQQASGGGGQQPPPMRDQSARRQQRASPVPLQQLAQMAAAVSGRANGHR